ncbi:uncharacterized protein MYCFIDRAFT_169575 [Pseudocercospora fijiensis CIRAD86]|uniref:Uncharacterized protein n=1 Tax=Pseudocercospora fijiensis (strain CIRAD86) TaxID=383855 RepID=N1Q6B0_PSEFD|nr:uncharacterized protein MYCFIDRAFT_169575 [Pseudocercospora fijiensis CIRAD86]EME87830.1 hypothetical protein MYCFIDRAFT_169575 [Pseudocercospora fijiensis CIRAD86]
MGSMRCAEGKAKGCDSVAAGCRLTGLSASTLAVHLIPVYSSKTISKTTRAYDNTNCLYIIYPHSSFPPPSQVAVVTETGPQSNLQHVNVDILAIRDRRPLISSSPRYTSNYNTRLLCRAACTPCNTTSRKEASCSHVSKCRRMCNTTRRSTFSSLGNPTTSWTPDLVWPLDEKKHHNKRWGYAPRWNSIRLSRRTAQDLVHEDLGNAEMDTSKVEYYKTSSSILSKTLLYFAARARNAPVLTPATFVLLLGAASLHPQDVLARVLGFSGDSRCSAFRAAATNTAIQGVHAALIAEASRRLRHIRSQVARNVLTNLSTDVASTGTFEGPAVTASPGFNLSSYCAAQMTTFFNTYNPTNSLTISTVTDYQGFFGTGTDSTNVVTQTYSTRTITFTEQNYMAYQLGGAKPPCCNSCHISAGTIQFYWWPDLASPTATTSSSGPSRTVTSIASNGFVFTSPSVYMAFKSVYAKNFCGTVGDIWYNTTIAFHPDDISTINAYTATYTSEYTTTEDGSVYTVAASVAGTQPPPSRLKYTDLAQNCSTLSGYNYFPNDPQNDLAGGFEKDPCHPILDIPPALINLQDAWKDNHCRRADSFSGAYDPPIALTQVDEAAQPTLPGGAQPGSASTAPSSARMTRSYTALPDMTGTRTWTLSTGTAAAAITIGSDVISANSAGAYVLDPENILSVGGASYGAGGTVYALETDASDHTVLLVVAATGSTQEPSSSSTASMESTRSGSAAPPSTTSSISTASRRTLDIGVGLMVFGLTIMIAL